MAGGCSDASEGAEPAEGASAMRDDVEGIAWALRILKRFSELGAVCIHDAVRSFEDYDLFSYLLASREHLESVPIDETASFLTVLLNEDWPTDGTMARSTDELCVYLRMFIEAYSEVSWLPLPDALEDLEENSAIGFVSGSFEIVKGIPPESLAILIGTVLDFFCTEE